MGFPWSPPAMSSFRGVKILATLDPPNPRHQCTLESAGELTHSRPASRGDRRLRYRVLRRRNRLPAQGDDPRLDRTP
jgi:hypothetical protein